MAKKKVKKKTAREKEESKERGEALFRILVLIISGIILGVWKALVCILVVINFFITLITGKRNRDMADFCEYWNTEAYKFLHYLTFVSNKRPFPFSKLEKMNRFE